MDTKFRSLCFLMSPFLQMYRFIQILQITLTVYLVVNFIARCRAFNFH